jgi:undecaprenyl-diphosphatase
MVDFDTSLLHHVIQLRRPWLDDVMVFASAIGAAGFLWWTLALITAVFPTRRAAACRLLLTIGFTFAVCDFMLKPLADRPRPFDTIPTLAVIDAKPDTPAFPSGHAAMAVAGAVAGSRMLPGAGWVLWPIGLIVAVSRIYVGVHWPTDVIAGALVGLACAWVVLGGRRKRPSVPH